jgi:hypothetical protein
MYLTGTRNKYVLAEGLSMFYSFGMLVILASAVLATLIFTICNLLMLGIFRVSVKSISFGNGLVLWSVTIQSTLVEFRLLPLGISVVPGEEWSWAPKAARAVARMMPLIIGWILGVGILGLWTSVLVVQGFIYGLLHPVAGSSALRSVALTAYSDPITTFGMVLVVWSLFDTAPFGANFGTHSVIALLDILGVSERMRQKILGIISIWSICIIGALIVFACRFVFG